MKNPLLLAVITGLLAPMLRAQTSPATPIQPASVKPAAYFRAMGVEFAPDGLFYQVGSNNVPLTIMPGMRSAPLGYSGSSPLVFFRQVPGTDGRITNQPVVAVNLSGTGSLPLLVFHKPVAANVPPVVTVYPEDGAAFPSGTVRILNEGTVPLVAKVDGKPLQIAPRSSKDQSASQDVFTVEISSVVAGREQLLFNANVGMVPGRRILFLVGPAPKEGAPVIVQRLLDSAPASR